MYTIQLATHHDMDRLQHFLALAKGSCPKIDQHVSLFLFAEEIDKKKIVGTVGLEVHQSVGLLRSFLIERSSWSARISLALMDMILSYAKCLLVQKVYLFTEKSNSFFEEWGFQKVPIEVFPNEIMESEYAKQMKDQSILMVYDGRQIDKKVLTNN